MSRATCSLKEPGAPDPRACPERALCRVLREGFPGLPEAQVLPWLGLLRGVKQVKSPCVFHLGRMVLGSGQRGACCNALRQSLPLTCLFSHGTALGSPPAPRHSSVRLVPLQARLPPDDLETERPSPGSRSGCAGWRCCLSLGGMAQLS